MLLILILILILLFPEGSLDGNFCGGFGALGFLLFVLLFFVLFGRFFFDGWFLLGFVIFEGILFVSFKVISGYLTELICFTNTFNFSKIK